IPRDTTQELSPTIYQGLQEADSDKAAVGHDKHPCLDRAQQAPGQTLFGGGTRGDHDINDGMGSYFSQIDAMHLRKRALSLPRTTPTKIGDIGFGVSHIFICPINSHQTQTKGKCPWCQRLSQRFALEHEETAKDLDSNLFASIHPSSSPWQFFRVLFSQ